MNSEQLDIKRSSLHQGLEFLGAALLEFGRMSDTESEKLGCLLLCLAEYAQSLESLEK
ncbi:hypothetical protein LVJ83_09420 [Uruburuella testudinis]|uniref:Rop-like protein n=1 Tax=Uruburuella testudinis TaxID=1282863 RepID=A0ABY4DQG0_9NEIS|nr:hypothetical protein [Uruburuella testudinis]UOO81188.1 hypothetical protein LVJ83_09420 [Uruburuella testudinis]